jgi:hypothetical protein
MASRVLRAAVPGAADGGELAPMRPKESLTPPIARDAETPGAGLTADPALVGDLGPGQALDPETRAFFEPRFGADLTQVRIHTDARADRAAKSVQARAFTLGHDIAFASGLYAPETPEGRELLAHELVHVLQADDGLTRQVMRDGPAPAGTSGSGPPTDQVDIPTPLALPKIKQRHSELYAGASLTRRRAYRSAERGSRQVATWDREITITPETVVSRIGTRLGFTTFTGARFGYRLQSETRNFVLGTGASAPGDGGGVSAQSALKRPDWDQNRASARMQVDHIHEMQLGGPDTKANYELLNETDNGASGRYIDEHVRETLQGFINASPQPAPVATLATELGLTGATKPSVQQLMDRYSLHFTTINWDGPSAGNPQGYWSVAQIEGLQHLDPEHIIAPTIEDGTASRFALFGPSGQAALARIPHSGRSIDFATGPAAGFARSIPGITLQHIELASDYDDKSAADVGSATYVLRHWETWSVPPDPRTMQLKRIGTGEAALQYAGKLQAGAGSSQGFRARLDAMSEAEFSAAGVDDNGLQAWGVIHPTHPLLDGFNIPVRIVNGEPGFDYMIDTTPITAKLRIPGLTVDRSSLSVFYTISGFGAGGMAQFTIRDVGVGFLEASASTSGRWELAGHFDFDRRIFDLASVDIAYGHEGFSVSGTIGITNPQKIRGLRSASATVSYHSQTGLSIQGTAQPDIPGIASATLRYANGPEGQQIEGAATLDRVPGIQGGTIGIRLTRRDADWKLSAQGEVTPDIPGITSRLTASYDDGAFTLGGNAAFQRGPFSGTVEVGATNRPVDAEGRVLDGAPTGELKAYGSGSVTARLTDSLQGTVGLKRRPDGRILLSGRIGIPQSVALFGRYPEPPWQKTLLTLPTVNIPIFGGGVGSFTIGIAATIGGALTATAHVGPGMLEDANIGITDFDPTDLSSLQVTGHARFVVPAYAGMRLGIDAGITGGAAVVSVTGGMNIGAELGILTQAVAEADLLWTPAAGLSLQATLSASVEPKLKFTVGAFVKADVSLLVTSFTIYRKDWQLAAFEYGPALRVGLSVPIAYRSGSGVDFDFDAIQFQLPSVTPRELIGGLLGSQGRQETHEP